MPTLNPAIEFLTCIIYAIVVLLVVDWPSQAIAEHAFREWRQSVDGIVL